MNPYSYSILLIFGGLIAASLWVFIVGIAGGPGAIVATLAMKKPVGKVLVPLGFILIVIGQLYVALIFMVFIIESSRSMLSDSGGFGYGLAWLVAFIIATAPTAIAVKDGAQATELNIQQYAVGLTSMLSIAGYFVFIFVPGAINVAWGWVPHF